MTTATETGQQKADLPPPGASIGVVRWMRENLFATIPSTILTLLAA